MGLDVELLVEEKNSKLRMLGKNEVYLAENNKVCIDLNKVDDKKLVIPDFVYGIVNKRENTDKENKTIETILFNDNIKYIEKYAFKNLIKLKEISDLDKVESINLDSILYGCKSLINAPLLPEYETKMIFTFSGCSYLKVVKNFPSKLIDMNYAFFGCDHITEFPKIPESVESIKFTFGICVRLEKAPELPNNIKYMRGAFSDCVSLLEAPIIPNGVIDISKAFKGCIQLKILPKIPESVQDKRGTYWGI